MPMKTTWPGCKPHGLNIWTTPKLTLNSAIATTSHTLIDTSTTLTTAMKKDLAMQCPTNTATIPSTHHTTHTTKNYSAERGEWRRWPWRTLPKRYLVSLLYDLVGFDPICELFGCVGWRWWSFVGKILRWAVEGRSTQKRSNAPQKNKICPSKNWWWCLMSVFLLQWYFFPISPRILSVSSSGGALVGNRSDSLQSWTRVQILCVWSCWRGWTENCFCMEFFE